MDRPSSGHYWPADALGLEDAAITSEAVGGSVAVDGSVVAGSIVVDDVATGFSDLQEKPEEDATASVDLKEKEITTGGVAMADALADATGKEMASGGADATSSKVSVDKEPKNSASEKRDYSDFLAPDDPSYYSDQVEYDSEDSVDEGNEVSFKRYIFSKLESGILKIISHGKYVCPFCPGKPKDGQKASLDQHAAALLHGASRFEERARHDVLARFLCGDELPITYKTSTKKAKRGKKMHY